MKILKNSAKCTACGVEVVSTRRHDFNAHFCQIEPTPEKDWGNSIDGEPPILVPNGKFTWRFAVDGGASYIRRVGSGFEDTSEWENG